MVGRKNKSVGKASLVSGKKVNHFHQHLGRLTYYQACQLLGEGGAALIRQGSEFEIDTERDVYLGGDLYRVRVADYSLPNRVAIVSVTLSSDRKKQLVLTCDQCEGTCQHVGASLSHLLDAKATLGLAEEPDESVPLENLTESELRSRMLIERRKRASDEQMAIRSMSPDSLGQITSLPAKCPEKPIELHCEDASLSSPTVPVPTFERIISVLASTY